MKPLFKRELKVNLKSFVIWTLLSSFLIIVAYWEYGAIGDPAQMGAIFNTFPEIAGILFGLSPLGMEDLLGYGALMQYYIYFIALAYAMILGSKMLQKELDDETAEFLFTKPITRQKICQTKAVVGMIYLVLFNVCLYLLTVGSMLYIGDEIYSNQELMKYMLISYIGLLLLMMVVYSLALSATVIFKSKRSASIIAGAFIAYSYGSSVAVLASEALSDWTIISPWRYFALDLIVVDQVKLIYPAILLVIIVISQLIAIRGIKVKQF